jgi:signal transduction histidine kinase
LPGVQRYQKKHIFVFANPNPQSMEKKNTSILYNGLIWGLIIGFAGIIYQVILYMLNQNLSQALGFAGLLITFGLLILGMRSFRDVIRDGILPFGTAFSFGIVAIVVSGIIGTVYGYLMWTVIDPDIVTRMMEMQTQKMLDRGLPDEAVEQAMGFITRFMKPGLMAVFGLVNSIVMGVILSLIAGAIMKREESTEAPLVEDEDSTA